MSESGVTSKTAQAPIVTPTAMEPDPCRGDNRVSISSSTFSQLSDVSIAGNADTAHLHTSLRKSRMHR
ncbi:hypothetical protein ACOMHN_022391 [Nucella lapillus]